MLDLIEDEEVVVVLTKKGYIKTVTADAFRRQGRGGTGVRGSRNRDDDYVDQLLTTTAHSYLLFFSNRGRVYRVRAHEIPMKDRTARGIALVNMIPLDAGRADPGRDRHPHVRRRHVPLLRHPEGPGEEDADGRLRLDDPQRPHRASTSPRTTSSSG